MIVKKTMYSGNGAYFASSDFHPLLSRGWNVSLAGAAGSPGVLIPAIGGGTALQFPGAHFLLNSAARL